MNNDGTRMAAIARRDGYNHTPERLDAPNARNCSTKRSVHRSRGAGRPEHRISQSERLQSHGTSSRLVTAQCCAVAVSRISGAPTKRITSESQMRGSKRYDGAESDSVAEVFETLIDF